MDDDFEAFHLSVHNLPGSTTYSGTDKLLERLKRVHGEPRHDIPPELEKHGQRQHG